MARIGDFGTEPYGDAWWNAALIVNARLRRRRLVEVILKLTTSNITLGDFD